MKIVYEINIQVSKDKEVDWVTWISDVHIPAICEVAKVSDAFLVKFDGSDGDTKSGYRVVFFFDNKEDLADYVEKSAPALREEHLALFGKDVVIERQVGVVMKWLEITREAD
ncbi:MAG: DUF4286 family protein [Bacteroidetes bacterium]|nr:DUF4286 family protein [Bacteroidota bacterium]